VENTGGVYWWSILVEYTGGVYWWSILEEHTSAVYWWIMRVHAPISPTIWNCQQKFINVPHIQWCTVHILLLLFQLPAEDPLHAGWTHYEVHPWESFASHPTHWSLCNQCPCPPPRCRYQFPDPSHQPRSCWGQTTKELPQKALLKESCANSPNTNMSLLERESRYNHNIIAKYA